jgi:hypothetical protein
MMALDGHNTFSGHYRAFSWLHSLALDTREDFAFQPLKRA